MYINKCDHFGCMNNFFFFSNREMNHEAHPAKRNRNKNPLPRNFLKDTNTPNLPPNFTSAPPQSIHHPIWPNQPNHRESDDQNRFSLSLSLSLGWCVSHRSRTGYSAAFISSNFENFRRSNHRIFARNRLATGGLVIEATIVAIGVPVLGAEQLAAATPEPRQSDLSPASGAPVHLPPFHLTRRRYLLRLRRSNQIWSLRGGARADRLIRRRICDLRRPCRARGQVVSSGKLRSSVSSFSLFWAMFCGEEREANTVFFFVDGNENKRIWYVLRF